MSDLIPESRPSPVSSLLKRSFRQVPCRQNFVRPAKQSTDPEFHCPKCSELLTVPGSQAGKKARCRHCYAAIRSAAPGRGLEAVDLSQDLDSLSHPQSYPLCGHRAATFDYIPRSAIAALPLLTLITLALALIALIPKGDAGRGAIAAAYHCVPMGALSSPAVEAEQLVSAFLTAPDWTYSVGHVYSGLEYAGQIASVTENLPEGDFRTTSKLNQDGSATVRVHFRDGTATDFKVAHIDGEDLIVWNNRGTNTPGADYSRMVGMPEMEPE